MQICAWCRWMDIPLKTWVEATKEDLLDLYAKSLEKLHYMKKQGSYSWPDNVGIEL